MPTKMIIPAADVADADPDTWDLSAAVATDGTQKGGLVNGTAYVAFVLSQASDPFTPTAFTTAPGQVTGLSATPGNGQVALSWSAPASDGGSAITDYGIEVSSDGGASWSTFADGTSDATTATVTGLGNDTEYTFRVAAVNAVGPGVPSATRTATPEAAPSAPAITTESGAVAHWVFGADNTSMLDSTSSQAMSKVGADAWSFNSGYVSCPNHAGNQGYDTGILDAEDCTLAAVVRVPSGATSRAMLFANANNTGSSGTRVFHNDTNNNFTSTFRNRANNQTGAVELDTWIFVAVSVDSAASFLSYITSSSGKDTTTGTPLNNTPDTDRNFGLGECFWEDGAYGGRFDVAELVIWHSALSESELDAVHARAQTRLLDRGITVV